MNCDCNIKPGSEACFSCPESHPVRSVIEAIIMRNIMLRVDDSCDSCNECIGVINRHIFKEISNIEPGVIFLLDPKNDEALEDFYNVANECHRKAFNGCN